MCYHIPEYFNVHRNVALPPKYGKKKGHLQKQPELKGLITNT